MRESQLAAANSKAVRELANQPGRYATIVVAAARDEKAW